MKSLLLAAFLCLFLTGCNWFGSSKPAPAPTPAPIETPAPQPVIARRVRFAYYGAFEEDSLPHVTATFAFRWGETEVVQLTKNMLLARAAGVNEVIFPVNNLCFKDGKYLGVDAVKPYLPCFEGMSVIFYPHDEPELDTQLSEKDLLACCRDLKALLPGALTMVIYGATMNFKGIAGFDLVGLDAYGMGSEVLGTTYEVLSSYLRPDQQLVVVPGVSAPWYQPLAPFLAYAMSNPRVGMICPFLWGDEYEGQPHPGARSNLRHDEYVAAGDALRKAD